MIDADEGEMRDPESNDADKWAMSDPITFDTDEGEIFRRIALTLSNLKAEPTPDGWREAFMSLAVLLSNAAAKGKAGESVGKFCTRWKIDLALAPPPTLKRPHASEMAMRANLMDSYRATGLSVRKAADRVRADLIDVAKAWGATDEQIADFPTAGTIRREHKHRRPEPSEVVDSIRAASHLNIVASRIFDVARRMVKVGDSGHDEG